jgi:ubiquinone/menaquinone biosynthesis C-methylase UbiE
MVASATERVAFAGLQTARVAFYGAHYLAARLIARENFDEIKKPAHKLPSLAVMVRAMADLFAQDWKNVETGLYPAPLDLRREARRALGSIRYLADVPKVAKRQKRHGHDEAKEKGEGKPRYYRQNFHYQTDGYLSDRSAQIYDFQVEALFAGTADAMRRRVYVPVAKYLEGRNVTKLSLLDIGAGTGRFLSFVNSVQPGLSLTALDLSAPYLARAKKALKAAKNASFVEAAAEDMPFPDASVDIAVSIYLFHELPPRVRVAAAKEIARVLKPGGIFVFADSIQYGDLPAFDGLLDVFPELLHEPYYSTYSKTDIAKLFGAAGLKHASDDIAYLTKVSVFEKAVTLRTKKE